MSDLERTTSRPPWGSRVVGWADGYVKKWALVLWTLGATGGGLAGGLLVGRFGNPDWVEAAGTWAGVFVGAGVGVVAYRAFIRETYDRTVDRHSEHARRTEERELEDQRQQADAQQVEIRASHGGAISKRTGDDGVEWATAIAVRLTVVNRSQVIAGSIDAYFIHPSGRLMRRSWLRIDGPDQVDDRIHLSDDRRAQFVRFEFPYQGSATRAFFDDRCWVEFDMHGRRWRRLTSGSLEEVVADDTG